MSSDGLNTKGMQELLKRLEKMRDVSDEQLDKALEVGAKVVKAKEVELAQKIHYPYSEDVGWKEIKTYKPKRRRNNARIIQTGIRGKQDKRKKEWDSPRSKHWDKIRGLWFNNYGFYHNKSGKYIAGSNWIGKAYEDSKDEAYAKMRKVILKELDL